MWFWHNFYLEKEEVSPFDPWLPSSLFSTLTLNSGFMKQTKRKKVCCKYSLFLEGQIQYWKKCTFFMALLCVLFLCICKELFIDYSFFLNIWAGKLYTYDVLITFDKSSPNLNPWTNKIPKFSLKSHIGKPGGQCSERTDIG